jgi:hypothetical protein
MNVTAANVTNALYLEIVLAINHRESSDDTVMWL